MFRTPSFGSVTSSSSRERASPFRRESDSRVTSSDATSTPGYSAKLDVRTRATAQSASQLERGSSLSSRLRDVNKNFATPTSGRAQPVRSRSLLRSTSASSNDESLVDGASHSVSVGPDILKINAAIFVPSCQLNVDSPQLIKTIVSLMD